MMIQDVVMLAMGWIFAAAFGLGFMAWLETLGRYARKLRHVDCGGEVEFVPAQMARGFGGGWVCLKCEKVIFPWCVGYDK